MGLAGELVQQGAKFGIEQAGKAFKKLAPSAVDNIGKMGREMNISPKSMYDVNLHLKRVPEDAADVESIFKGMKAEDPDAFEAADGFFHTLGFGNDAAAKLEANTAVKAQVSGKAANVTPQKSWNLWDEITSDENVAKYQELSTNNPGNFVDEGLAFRNELQLGENSNLYKYLNEQGNEVNAEFAAFLQTVDPETRASYIDLLIEAADDLYN